MTLFELVKQNICVPDAAKHYGLQVNRNGMCSCPFHEDQHPSMKLNEQYFYCFGCGATGDVIDLVARLFGLNSYEAAQKLAQDFGIDPDKPPAAIALPRPKRPLLKAYRFLVLHYQEISLSFPITLLFFVLNQLLTPFILPPLFQ